MSNLQRLNSVTAIVWLQIVGVALSPGAASAADDVIENQILRALTAKKELARGVVMGPRADPAAEASFVETIRGLERVLTADERDKVADIVKDKPQVDLEITFDYDSAEINSKSLPSVQALGRALKSPELRGSTIVVAGHTDAAGLETYNQHLSQRRADSIKRYLIEKFGIPSSELVPVGFGKTKLKDPNRPFAETNRRVQVSNISQGSGASK